MPSFQIPNEWSTTINLFSVVITMLAVIIALFTPWVANWISNKPKKSKLKIIGTSTVDQANETYEADHQYEHYFERLIIKNEGKFIAKSVEASLQEVVCEKEKRKNFFPVPLIWTHGQSGAKTTRNIYPQQTVYLDILVFGSDSHSDEAFARFCIGYGSEIETLTFVPIGKSNISIKFYQESGQTNEVHLKIHWDGIKKPEILIQ